MNKRETPIDIRPDEFQKLGYELIDRIAHFLENIGNGAVTPGESPSELQALLGNISLPETGTDVHNLLSGTTDLLLDHSLFNGHPRFMGYITSSAAPLGILSELLATAVNPNVGAHILSPMATEIEKQTVRWLAEFIGVSSDYGGILVSGGNMANFTAFVAARQAKAPDPVAKDGMSGASGALTVYCSKTTHTWIDKAAMLFGFGTRSVRWIKTDPHNKIDLRALEDTLTTDLAGGCKPIMVIGTAGDVSTGAVDDLEGLSAIARKYDLWFHIDGAYGIPAAVVPSLKDMFTGLTEADSIALDPHKWLYSPLEAGCTLVKNPQHLLDTFSSHPDYYRFDAEQGEIAQNYYEYGLQNSRGFRALKVWLTLQQVGRSGYEQLISDDIELSKYLFRLAAEHEELEAVTQNLSIATFRYIPSATSDPAYLNKLNEALLDRLQKAGQVFLSNAIVSGKYCLRGCIVNFRTSAKDIEEIIRIVVSEGRKTHEQLK